MLIYSITNLCRIFCIALGEDSSAEVHHGVGRQVWAYPPPPGGPRDEGGGYPGGGGGGGLFLGVKNRYSLLSSRQPTRQFIQYLKTRFLPPPPPNSTPPRARISRHPDGFCVQNPARPRAEKVEFASELQLEANDWRVLFCDYRKTFTKSGKQIDLSEDLWDFRSGSLLIHVNKRYSQ